MKHASVVVLGWFLIFAAALLSAAKILPEGITVMPDGDYIVSSGDLLMTVNPRVGARIVSLRLGEYEFLTGRDIMQGNYGSTFWPSPQSSWSWPPPAVLDSDPYSASRSGDTARFVSWKDGRTGLQVVKEFSPGKNGRIDLIYSMTNVTDSTIKAAPWEITRVHKGGLLFFPVGRNPLGKKSFDPAPVEVVDGVAWYEDPAARPDKNLLTTADGTEGWAAYAIDGRLFMKKFPDVAGKEIAPGEGEIAFYVSREADYVEFEVQGEYRRLVPGERAIWKVQWMAADIPHHIKVGVGSGGLLEFARKLAK